MIDEMKDFIASFTCTQPSALNDFNFGQDSARIRIPFSVIPTHHEISQFSRCKQLDLNTIGLIRRDFSSILRDHFNALIIYMRT